MEQQQQMAELLLAAYRDLPKRAVVIPGISARSNTLKADDVVNAFSASEWSAWFSGHAEWKERAPQEALGMLQKLGFAYSLPARSVRPLPSGDGAQDMSTSLSTGLNLQQLQEQYALVEVVHRDRLQNILCSPDHAANRVLFATAYNVGDLRMMQQLLTFLYTQGSLPSFVDLLLRHELARLDKGQGSSASRRRSGSGRASAAISPLMSPRQSTADAGASSDESHALKTLARASFVVLVPELLQSMTQALDLVEAHCEHFLLDKDTVHPLLLAGNATSLAELATWLILAIAKNISSCSEAQVDILRRVYKKEPRTVLRGMWKALDDAWAQRPSSADVREGRVRTSLRRLLQALFTEQECPVEELEPSAWTELRARIDIIRNTLEEESPLSGSMTARRKSMSASKIDQKQVLSDLRRDLQRHALVAHQQFTAMQFPQQAVTPASLALLLSHAVALASRPTRKLSSSQRLPTNLSRKRRFSSSKRRSKSHRERSFSSPQAVLSSSSSIAGVTQVPVQSMAEKWNELVCRGCGAQVVAGDQCPQCEQSIYATPQENEDIPAMLCIIQQRRYELGVQHVTGDPMRVSFQKSPVYTLEKDSPIAVADYSREFFYREHEVFFAVSSDPDASVICCMARDPETGTTRVLTITTDGYLRSTHHIRTTRPSVRWMDVMEFSAAHKCHRVSSVALKKELVEFELSVFQRLYKFGVLFMEEGQSQEHELYNNVGTTPQFNAFLSLLGTRVDTESPHPGYRGGLPNNVPFYYKRYTTKPARDELEIVYHVASLMPLAEKDAQQLERKRHLGNDVVLVIFREHGTQTPLVPKFLSKFNHVFVVVQPAELEENGVPSSYYVQVSALDGVSPFGPHIPVTPFYKPIPATDFGKFMTHKLLNAERAAMRAPDFQRRFKSVRRQFMQDLFKTHLK